MYNSEPNDLSCLPDRAINRARAIQVPSDRNFDIDKTICVHKLGLVGTGLIRKLRDMFKNLFPSC